MSYAALFRERAWSLLPASTRRIRHLRNEFNGRRAFIVGNGPSLNDLDLTKLRQEYTFGVNSIFLQSDFTPTFYVVEDKHVIRDNWERVRSVPAEYTFAPNRYIGRLGRDTIYYRPNRAFYEDSSPYVGIPRFSMDAARELYFGQTVTYLNLQLAMYMGFTSIYLIGMDFSYSIPDDADIRGDTITSRSADPNHFHPEYFGSGKKWHDPKLDLVGHSYALAKLMYQMSGRQIFNATAGGSLELFDRVDYAGLFP